MTQAKITAQAGYRCAPDGHTVVTLPVGTVVTGQIAEWAMADKMAARMFDPREEKKIETATETKAAPRKRGRPRKKAAD